MNKNILFKKTLVFAVIVLFFCISVTPSINAIINYNSVGKKYNEPINDIISNPLNSVNDFDVVSLTFYTFDKSGRSQNTVELSSDVAVNIKDLFDELNYNIVNEPKSVETQELKDNFISLIDENNLLPDRQSKDEVFSLLNPDWLKLFNDNLKVRNPFANNLFRSFFGSNFGTSFFCSVSSAGSGVLMPLFMLPRPRAVAVWVTSPSYYYGGITSVASMITGKGFIAVGAQRGLLLGFMGVGLSYAVPGYIVYGFIGYSLFAGVNAEYMEFYPPNREPVISNENPLDNAVGVPLDIGELSFKIEDADGDLMDYQVTTEPNIGSDVGVNKKSGFYKVAISGLNSKTLYNWKVVVFDGKATVEKTFSFTTVSEEPIVYNPIPWDEQRDVSLSFLNLSFSLKDYQGDLMDYSVETSPFIGSGSGVGVGNGVYSVSVGGLNYSTDYTWFVNVTDGIHWTRVVFSFQTGLKTLFDPFEEGWLYRKQIVIDHDLVAGNLVDFPVLISTVDSDLRDKVQDDGDDILFMDGPGFASRLYHEIEFFDGSSGKLVVWVNVSGLSSSEDTVFYMYYGNLSSINQEYPEMVWDSNYMMVQHFDEIHGDLRDSTFYGNDGIVYGGVTQSSTGKIDNAYSFDGINDYIDLGNPASLNPQNEITVGAWYKTVSFKGTGNNPIVDKGYYSHTYPYYQYHLGVTGDHYNPPNLYAHFFWQITAGGQGVGLKTNEGFWTPGNWYYIVGTYNGSTESLYVNIENAMTLIKSIPLSGTMQDYGKNVYIAKYTNSNNFTPGIIDEIHISNIARAQDWISTELNNQNDPSSFLSFGPEESPP